jgi:hypothetical protein
MYRVRRFLRRNRTLILSAVSVLFALAFGLTLALYQRNEALAQRAEAERETARVKQVIGQRDTMLASLQRQVENSGTKGDEFQVAVASLTKDFQKTVSEDERIHGTDRGEADPYAYVLRARNYEVLGRLLTLSGDKVGARKAYQGCVTSLTRAQRSGDGTPATGDAMRRCAAGV